MWVEGACKGSLTWAGSCWLVPLVWGFLGGTWGWESPSHRWLRPLQQSPTMSYRFLLALGVGALALDRGLPLTFGLRIAHALQGKVCTIILRMGRRLVAAAPSQADLLTVLPRLLAGSLQSYGLHGKMLTQQVGRDGERAWEGQAIQHGHMIMEQHEICWKKQAQLLTSTVFTGSVLYGTVMFLFLHFCLLNMNLLFQDVMREWGLGAEISEREGNTVPCHSSSS